MGWRNHAQVPLRQHSVQDVPEHLLFGFQMEGVFAVRRSDERHTPFDIQSEIGNAPILERVVCHQHHLCHPQVLQDLGTDGVVSRIHLETRLEIRLNGIEALVLRSVGPQFLGQPAACRALRAP